MPNIIDQEDLYNVIVLAGKRSPGKVTLSGHDRKVVWDVQGGPFLNGAIVRYKWTPPVEFTASFYLTKAVADEPDDFTAWPAFQKVIESSVSNPRKPSALPIYHPDLAANDIKSVVKAEIGGMIYDGKGGGTIAVKFQEYRPPRKQEGVPQAKPQPDPNAALKKQLDALTTQYQNTPWG
jgi:hypothetical protein